MQIKKLIALSLLFFFVGQTSCGRKNDLPAKSFGGTFTLGCSGKYNTLNPLTELSGPSALLTRVIFDGLIKIGEGGNALPHLASSWKVSEGGRKWTFHLRRGVRFHDGHPFTADDVAFTLNLLAKGTAKAYPPISEKIAKIEIEDPYTISIFLDKPSSSFIYALAVPIVPRHILQGRDIRSTSFNYQPVGTGPFRLLARASDRIELEANQDYFLGRPYLDRLVVRIFDNQRLVWSHLMRGEIDAFEFFNAESYRIIKKIPSFRIYSSLRDFYYLIGFNLAKPLFKDRRVRQALNYAVDKESIITRVLKGRGMVASGTVFPYSWAYDPNVCPFPYDPIKAMELLREAGWQDTNGDHVLDRNGQRFEFQLCLPEGHDELDLASLMIVEQLSSLGIVVNIKKAPISILDRDCLIPRKFDAAFLYLLASSDPDKNYQFWHSSQIESGLNIFSYRNPRIDQLLDQGRRALSQEKRKIIYRDYQEEMHHDPAGIFLFWREYFFCVHKRYGGIEISPYGGLFKTVCNWYLIR